MVNKILNTKNKTKTIFVAPELSFKKQHKGLIADKVYKQNIVTLGSFALGIKALESARITPKQNESLRRVLVKKFKNVVIATRHSLIPSVPITKKAMGIRMGKGKGAVSYWINKLTASKISLYMNIPHILDNLQHLKHSYTTISKRFNYTSKMVINTHFIQERHNILDYKNNYWKFIIN